MKTLIIGDVHGDWGALSATLQAGLAARPDASRVVQVGDMGFGFPGLHPSTASLPLSCAWIDGNHENFDMLQKRHLPSFGLHPASPLHPDGWQAFLAQWHYLPRGTVQGGVLYIGGARSIDRHLRVPGRDWWAQEELTYGEQTAILDAVAGTPVHTVISHDAPAGFDLSAALGRPAMLDNHRWFLEEIRMVARPRAWYFGHYHVKASGTTDGCTWRCLDTAASGDYAVADI